MAASPSSRLPCLLVKRSFAVRASSDFFKLQVVVEEDLLATVVEDIALLHSKLMQSKALGAFNQLANSAISC